MGRLGSGPRIGPSWPDEDAELPPEDPHTVASCTNLRRIASACTRASLARSTPPGNSASSTSSGLSPTATRTTTFPVAAVCAERRYAVGARPTALASAPSINADSDRGQTCERGCSSVMADPAVIAETQPSSVAISATTSSPCIVAAGSSARTTCRRSVAPAIDARRHARQRHEASRNESRYRLTSSC